MVNRKMKAQAMTEVNWTRRTMSLEIVRTIMITVMKMNTEMLVMILFFFLIWCGKILTIIFSYQTC